MRPARRRRRCSGSRPRASSTPSSCRRWRAPRRSWPRCTASRHGLRRPGPQRARATTGRRRRRRRGPLRFPATDEFGRRNQNATTEEGLQTALALVAPARSERAAGHRDHQRRLRLPVRRARSTPERVLEHRRAAEAAPGRRDLPGRHDRRRRSRRQVRELVGRRATRAARAVGAALPQHPQHRLRERGRRRSSRARRPRRQRRRPGRLPVRAARDRQHRHRGPRLPAARHGVDTGIDLDALIEARAVARRPAGQGAAGDARPGRRLPCRPMPRGAATRHPQVAVVQHPPVTLNREKTLERGVELLEKAAAGGRPPGPVSRDVGTRLPGVDLAPAPGGDYELDRRDSSRACSRTRST